MPAAHGSKVGHRWQQGRPPIGARLAIVGSKSGHRSQQPPATMVAPRPHKSSSPLFPRRGARHPRGRCETVKVASASWLPREETQSSTGGARRGRRQWRGGCRGGGQGSSAATRRGGGAPRGGGRGRGGCKKGGGRERRRRRAREADEGVAATRRSRNYPWKFSWRGTSGVRRKKMRYAAQFGPTHVRAERLRHVAACVAGGGRWAL
jgi:hypothetical protein